MKTSSYLIYHPHLNQPWPSWSMTIPSLDPNKWRDQFSSNHLVQLFPASNFTADSESKKDLLLKIKIFCNALYKKVEALEDELKKMGVVGDLLFTQWGLSHFNFVSDVDPVDWKRHQGFEGGYATSLNYDIEKEIVLLACILNFIATHNLEGKKIIPIPITIDDLLLFPGQTLPQKISAFTQYLESDPILKQNIPYILICGFSASKLITEESIREFNNRDNHSIVHGKCDPSVAIIRDSTEWQYTGSRLSFLIVAPLSVQLAFAKACWARDEMGLTGHSGNEFLYRASTRHPFTPPPWEKLNDKIITDKSTLQKIYSV